jgi:murein DD-endopeptidase MepM/ murein hydrolase activator NlpD
MHNVAGSAPAKARRLGKGWEKSVQGRQPYISTLLLAALLSCSAFGQEIYKYQDPSGKWVFTDKRPAATQEAESLVLEERKATPHKPRVFTQTRDDWHYLIADNPLHAPVEIRVLSDAFAGGALSRVLPAAGQEVLHKSQAAIAPVRYGWQLGDPAAREVDYLYNPPTPFNRLHRVSQSFNGRFSHTDIANRFAVDIAMPVGSDIHAAREGTVIWTKDDYHMSGRTQYFLDKANYIKVLHADGTYAVYAHILIGSARVKPGDRVAVGDVLARSGSSGYSTGPHLHFVIRKNNGLQTVSIPFSFRDADGAPFTPREGMKLRGIAPSQIGSLKPAN